TSPGRARTAGSPLPRIRVSARSAARGGATRGGAERAHRGAREWAPLLSPETRMKIDTLKTGESPDLTPLLTARAEGKNGREVIVVGLDAAHAHRLMRGDGIFVDGAADGLGSPVDMMILCGETLGDVVKDLEAAGITLPSEVIQAARPRPKA